MSSSAAASSSSFGMTSRYQWPAESALVPSVVALNLGPGLSSPPPELLEVVGEEEVESTQLRLGGTGKKKRDDVFVQLRTPLPMGDLSALEATFRSRLSESSSELMRESATRAELVPGGVSLGAAAPLQDGLVVVDTDALSMLFKKDSRSAWMVTALDQQAKKLISFQTAAELHAWILLRHFPPEKIRKLEQMLSEYEVVWPDNLTSLLWAQLIDYGRAHGRPTGPQDAWVAAVALRHGAKLCTNNLKDYDYLPGITFLTRSEASAPASTTDTPELARGE